MTVNNTPINERLAEVGVFVTDKKQGWIRMLVDKDGKELGFLKPLQAIKKFVDPTILDELHYAKYCYDNRTGCTCPKPSCAKQLKSTP